RFPYTTLFRSAAILGQPARQNAKQGAQNVRATRPILIDRFLEDAMEVDVDCISDGETTVIGAIMEHIEQAGIHSGDSACVIPTFSLAKTVLAEISSATRAMARELNVRGLMNVQFAVSPTLNRRGRRRRPYRNRATFSSA